MWSSAVFERCAKPPRMRSPTSSRYRSWREIHSGRSRRLDVADPAVGQGGARDPSGARGCTGGGAPRRRWDRHRGEGTDRHRGRLDPRLATHAGVDGADAAARSRDRSWCWRRRRRAPGSGMKESEIMNEETNGVDLGSTETTTEIDATGAPTTAAERIALLQKQIDEEREGAIVETHAKIA